MQYDPNEDYIEKILIVADDQPDFRVEVGYLGEGFTAEKVLSEIRNMFSHGHKVRLLSGGEDVEDPAIAKRKLMSPADVAGFDLSEVYQGITNLKDLRYLCTANLLPTKTIELDKPIIVEIHGPAADSPEEDFDNLVKDIAGHQFHPHELAWRPQEYHAVMVSASQHLSLIRRYKSGELVHTSFHNLFCLDRENVRCDHIANGTNLIDAAGIYADHIIAENSLRQQLELPEEALVDPYPEVGQIFLAGDDIDAFIAEREQSRGLGA